MLCGSHIDDLLSGLLQRCPFKIMFFSVSLVLIHNENNMAMFQSIDRTLRCPLSDTEGVLRDLSEQGLDPH